MPFSPASSEDVGKVKKVCTCQLLFRVQSCSIRVAHKSVVKVVMLGGKDSSVDFPRSVGQPDLISA